MFDLCAIFKTFQKLLQKSNLILPDVLTAKDSAVENLKIMKDIAVPGGKEELNLELQEGDNEQGRPTRRTSTAHQFVTSRNRDSNAIMNEIVQSAINFLGQRMNTENDGTIESLISILDETSSKDLVLASRDLVSSIFGPSYLSDFVSYVCKSWNNLTKIEHFEVEDTGTTYALRLRKMTQASCGLLKKFLASFLTLVPHSMATERVVFHYNNVKTSGRSSLHPETINVYCIFL
jgi:hypothetical protein